MPGFELIGKEEKEAINEIFEKSNGVLYQYGFNDRRNHIFRVKEFEKQIAQKVNSKYGIFVNTGTAAEKLALIGLGVKAGDEVITQSHTFIATVEAILELGAIPVITEVDKTLNMDPEDLKLRISSKTKVIIPVHMAGVAAKMDEIMAIANEHNISVLEDSAQALGGTYKGKSLGTIADVGIYSTDFGKAITTGEGGILVTDNPEIYKIAREYSDHGHENNPNFPRGEDTRSTWGFNYKISEIAGAIGLAQLKKLDYIIKKQRENKYYIKNSLNDIKGIEFREVPNPEGDAGDTLIFFVENKSLAKKVSVELGKIGIGTKNLPDAINWHFAGTWTQIFHNFPEYKGKDLETIWPKSTALLRRAIALPIMLNYSKKEMDTIIKGVRDVLSENSIV
jgi:8-amino-3,8-dideoxy-alpha-D-manno-octulosonate transaminase